MSSRLLRLLSASLVALCVPALSGVPAVAQNTTGEISGYVRDSTGGVLPGATVTLTFPAIAYERVAVTNEAGLFVFPGVPNGTADLAVELDGFKPVTRKNIAVELNARMRVDVTLDVGALAETLEVVAETAPPISTRADVSSLITGAQTKEMPIDGRSYMQLMALVPGATRNDNSYEFGTSFRADGQQINGLRKNFSALTLDGSENLDAGSNATQVNNVSIDAIEEFKVLSSQYSAEFGKAGGAQINVVTKSGKRDFSGGFYGFMRDDRFDAKNFQTNRKDTLDFKNYGWNIGGPVAWSGFNADRSKLFFFVAQEWKALDTTVGQTSSATTPSLLERQGNFSASPRVPVDPLTGRPFPGGVIPADRLSPLGLALANKFPLPDTGQRNTVTMRPVQMRDIREDIVRLDYRPQPSSNLTFRMIRDRVEQIEPYGSFGGTSTYDLVPTSHDRWSDSYMVSYSHTIGSNIFHEASFSGVRNDQYLEQTGDAYKKSDVAFAEIFPSNRGDRLPNVRTLTGYPMGQGLFGVDYPTRIVGNYYVFKDNLTISRGSHTWKGGLYLGHFRKTEEIRTVDSGSFAFADTTFPGSGVALGNMLLGIYDQYTEADRAPYPSMRYNQFEIYAQDHWSVTPSLSLDFGLRYQFMPAMYERDDLISTFDPELYDPSLAPRLDSRGNLVPGTGLLENGIPVNGIAMAGQNGVPRGLYSADKNNVAPRGGFVWDPWKNGRTAIRGGFGVFFDRPVMNSTRDQAASPPFVRTVLLSNGRVENVGGGTASTAPPGGFEALDTHLKAPTIYQWSVGVQRMLPWRLTLDVNYVGNEARNLLRVRELNFVTPGANGVASTPINANRPYTGYGRITVNETTANSDYQGLQLQLNRRSDTDFSFGVAYTLSRSRNDADSEDSPSSGNMAQDPRNPGGEWASQDFDRRHVLSVNYIYFLPWYRNSRSVAGHLLGGWQITGITRFNTGRRLNITAGTNTAIFGDQITLRANGVEGVDPNSEPEGGRTARMWLNPAAFARPATNTLGNLPRNVVEGPSFINTDLSLFKNVQLPGKWKVQLRAEVFNVFNQKNYQTIATSFTAANFGQVTAYQPQRIFQFGMKINF